MQLPDFTRIAWASADARAVWEPRVRAVSAALLNMEIESVRRGVRLAALQFTPDVASLRRFDGLAFAPVAPGRCVVAGDQGTVNHFLDAWHRHDDESVGMLLGFPACCRSFFHQTWNTLKLKDTTLAMGGDSTTPMAGCNILGRWLGVRLVPHLPCNWQCGATSRNAKELAACWKPTELAWADEMLSWPMEYSALHGIAIVTTPVTKVITNTDYTPHACVLRVEGTRFPAEGATGLKFPFQNPRSNVVTLTPKVVNTWSDNGFISREAMDAGHAMVMEAVGTDPSLEVIDLGCGNGRLLEKIAGCFKVGVEIDQKRAAAGLARGVDIRVGRIQDLKTLVTESFGTALISQRRLEEFTPSETAEFNEWLRTHAAELVVYSYDAPTFARKETVCTASPLT